LLTGRAIQGSGKRAWGDKIGLREGKVCPEIQDAVNA
jgi:hypothetical protein